MRTSDPAAYDQFTQIVTPVVNNTYGDLFSGSFRAIYATAPSTGAVIITLGISQNTNGQLVEKELTFRIAANASFLLPISGETLRFKSPAPTGIVVYALI